MFSISGGLCCCFICNHFDTIRTRSSLSFCWSLSTLIDIDDKMRWALYVVYILFEVFDIKRANTNFFRLIYWKISLSETMQAYCGVMVKFVRKTLWRSSPLVYLFPKELIPHRFGWRINAMHLFHLLFCVLKISSKFLNSPSFKAPSLYCQKFTEEINIPQVISTNQIQDGGFFFQNSVILPKSNEIAVLSNAKLMVCALHNWNSDF